MRYKIKDEKGEVVNRIVADEKFVKEKHDGLFELIPESEIVILPEVSEPTMEERLAELESKLSSIDSSLKTLVTVSVSK